MEEHATPSGQSTQRNRDRLEQATGPATQEIHRNSALRSAVADMVFIIDSEGCYRAFSPGAGLEPCYSSREAALGTGAPGTHSLPFPPISEVGRLIKQGPNANLAKPRSLAYDGQVLDWRAMKIANCPSD